MGLPASMAPCCWQLALNDQRAQLARISLWALSDHSIHQTLRSDCGMSHIRTAISEAWSDFSGILGQAGTCLAGPLRVRRRWKRPHGDHRHAVLRLWTDVWPLVLTFAVTFTTASIVLSCVRVALRGIGIGTCVQLQDMRDPSLSTRTASPRYRGSTERSPTTSSFRLPLGAAGAILQSWAYACLTPASALLTSIVFMGMAGFLDPIMTDIALLLASGTTLARWLLKGTWIV